MTPAACICSPMCVVEVPGSTSTKVSLVGPNGSRTSQAATPPARRAIKKAMNTKAAAPELLCFLLWRLRPTILWLLTLHPLETREFPFGFPIFDCIGREPSEAGDFIPGGCALGWLLGARSDGFREKLHWKLNLAISESTSATAVSG